MSSLPETPSPPPSGFTENEDNSTSLNVEHVINEEKKPKSKIEQTQDDFKTVIKLQRPFLPVETLHQVQSFAKEGDCR